MAVEVIVERDCHRKPLPAAAPLRRVKDLACRDDSVVAPKVGQLALEHTLGYGRQDLAMVVTGLHASDLVVCDYSSGLTRRKACTPSQCQGAYDVDRSLDCGQVTTVAGVAFTWLILSQTCTSTNAWTSPT